MNGRGVYNLQELVLEGYTEQDFMSYQSKIMSDLAHGMYGGFTC